MTVYEGMFILDPAKYSRDPAGSAQQVADIITQNGGTILAARLWDERKLAYPIKGHKKGVYWLTYFRMEGANLAALELVTFMSLVGQVFALGYLDKEWSLARFYALVGFFEGAMAGVVLSSNLFMSYFLLEMLTLST